MPKRRKNTGAICAALVIVAMILGILIGVLIGKTMNSDKKPAKETVQESFGQTVPSGETAPEQTTETVPETVAGSESENGVVVVTVNGREVMMEEVNYYLYSLRDYYVGLYGEEPWSTTMDDGKTVAEYAKEQLLEDIIKTQILDGQAEAYDIEITAEQSAQFADSAQSYLSNLGADISEQFGLNATAIAKVFEDGELSTAVYNAVIEKLSTDMKADTNYSSLSDEDFEKAVGDAYNEMFKQWKDSADIKTSDIWDSIVVGSVG